MPFPFGFLIGRFQPFHEGHAHLVRVGLSQCQQLIIVIGSADRARTVRNPFTASERKALILANFAPCQDRIVLIESHDYLYDEAAWITDIQDKVNAITQHQKTALIGHTKDASSYYLKEFPDDEYLEVDDYQHISATPLREAYLLGDEAVLHSEAFTQTTRTFLSDFKRGEHYPRLAKEAQFLKAYQASFAQAPYPPIFVTTDAVVVCDQHILLIQRKLMPGAMLWALPGGFLEQNERIVDGLIRELKEETSIAIKDDVLRACLQTQQVFDHPTRSQIGRVITHAGLFLLPSPLPDVSAADDALQAKWVRLETFWQMQSELHDDHYQLVRYLMKD